MKRYGVLLFAVIFASGCASVTTKNFKVFTEPSDAAIKVVSGVELKEQKYASPARITAEVPTDPALAKKAVLEVTRENYKTKTIALRSIKDGDILNLKLEKIRDIVKYKLSYRLVSPATSPELKFRDKIIAISFAIGERSFQMRFENLSARDVKILWERAMYTDPDKQTHRLMHSGIRFQDRNNPLPDQVVPFHSSVQDGVIPVSNVYKSQEKKGYDVRPLLPVESDAAAGLKGKTLNLFIPVEFDRQIVPYSFTIEITDAVKEAIK